MAGRKTVVPNKMGASMKTAAAKPQAAAAKPKASSSNPISRLGEYAHPKKKR
jgi:hypothetical protein